MVVGGVSRAGPGATSVRRSAGSRPFRAEPEKAGKSDAAVGTHAVAMTSLLALQEAESGSQRDREAQRHGEAMLDELGGLQRALLGDGEAGTKELARLAGQTLTAADPGLAGVVRAIQLRAGIELARRGGSVGP